MLEHLTGDVQGYVGRVHHALDKAQVVGQQIGAVLHDQHTAGVELQSLLIILGVEIIGRLAGDEQQRLIGDRALHGDGEHSLGRHIVKELFLIELVVFLVAHLALAALPQGHHAVDGLHFLDVLVLGLVVGAALLAAVGRHLHLDGVADIVGILADQLRKLVLLQKFGVVLPLGVGLDVHDDVGAHAVALRLGDGVAVRAGGFPHPRLVLAVFLRDHSDGVGHHEGGVKAHAELADDVHLFVFLVLLRHFLAEAVGAGGGDNAQVVFQIFLVHADAVIRNGEGPRLGVRLEEDPEITAVHAHVLIRQRQIAQLVLGVAGVGDQLAQEDLLVRVDRVDHQVQQALGLCLKLFFCHISQPPL